MLRHVLFFLSTFFSLSIYPVIYYPKNITASQVQRTPKKDIQVAWDIHNVIAKKDSGAKFGAIMGNIFTLGWSKMTGNKAWDEIKKLSKNNDISGEGYASIFLKHGNKDLAEFALDAANAYKPRKGMEQLIRDIHNAGIVQRYASNIGPRALANLDSKFKRKHTSRLFDLIKPGKIVDYSSLGKTVVPAKQPAPHLSPIGKPHPQFYADFNKTYVINKNSPIIFIDDKIENVRAAVQAGWIGIHFDATKEDKKSVAQLRTQLASLGIFKK